MAQPRDGGELAPFAARTSHFEWLDAAGIANGRDLVEVIGAAKIHVTGMIEAS